MSSSPVVAKSMEIEKILLIQLWQYTVSADCGFHIIIELFWSKETLKIE